MKRTIHFLASLAVLMVLVLSSCTSYKHVPYIQNSNEVDLTMATSLYDARIMPKDILQITVNCPEDENATRMFNLTVPVDPQNSANGTIRNLQTQRTLQQYLVSNEGTIEFPMLGEISVGGRTKTELEAYIASRIYPTYLKQKPIVTVTMANYKVIVTGEVTRAGVYTATNGKMNLFEALAMAGDMTIYGRRDCVKIIREDAQGRKTINEVNLNDANIIASPFYQLQQNDVVYVTPNKTKAKNSGIGSETSLWFTSVSIVVSVASLLFNILRK
ncbi:MAG: polysaccharide biosynthesis/export family protein [Bacteroidaceae bacterium]|nr:polysaccharide biosynthesis/export family protein [Bacteroidaceae bacterium]